MQCIHSRPTAALTHVYTAPQALHMLPDPTPLSQAPRTLPFPRHYCLCRVGAAAVGSDMPAADRVALDERLVAGVRLAVCFYYPEAYGSLR